MKNLILLIMLIFIAAGISFAIPFLPSVGGKAGKADREDYKKRAYNYDGKVFHNDPEVNVMEKVEDNDPARMSGNSTSPDFELPVKKPQIENNPDESFFAITWLGHSSLFIQMHGRNILVDPVFSERISPVSWIGPKRFSQPSVAIDDLPEIDILVLTHDHYDHMDYGALKKLAMPVHWGAIVLSTNGWDDSVLRFVKAAEEKKLNYITPYLCETVDISNPQNYREQWWK